MNTASENGGKERMREKLERRDVRLREKREWEGEGKKRE